MTNAARNTKGQFTARGNKAEAAARDAKRMPTTRHVSNSVGVRTGTLRLDASTNGGKLWQST